MDRTCLTVVNFPLRLLIGVFLGAVYRDYSDENVVVDGGLA